MPSQQHGLRRGKTVSALYKCQQILPYKFTAVLLFSEKRTEQVCHLSTMDIQEKESKVRSYYSAPDVTDVALYTETEKIHLMKNGNLVRARARRGHFHRPRLQRRNVPGGVTAEG